MYEQKSPPESIIEQNKEIALETFYFTMKGKEEFCSDNGYPLRHKEDNLTYAKQTGERRQLRIDSNGFFMNPFGLFPQKIRGSRWINVTDKIFTLYTAFLKSKNPIFLTNAEREML